MGEIKNNTIYGRGGIFITGDIQEETRPRVTIENNTFNSTIRIEADNSETIIRNNRILDPIGCGILSIESILVVEHNIISNASFHAIYATNSEITIDNNTIVNANADNYYTLHPHYTQSTHPSLPSAQPSQPPPSNEYEHNNSQTHHALSL